MRNIIKKKKNVYFSNIEKIIKHYPMTDRLIVRGGYIFIFIIKNFYSHASSSWQGVLDTTLCDSDLRQVGGFPCVLRFPPPIKLTDRI
jgi:hypothetical protein